MSVGIGVIGAGVMGADHARIISSQIQGAHLAALSDANEARAKAVAEKYGAERHLADGAALTAADEVDAVLIASPDETHAAFVLACLEAGKPVLCEKPLAPTAADALKLVEAEVAHGKQLIRVGFMRRFDPFYGAMRETLRGGSLGRALMVHSAHRNVSAPDWFTPTNSITNSAVHEFDILRWLLDEEIVAVSAFKSGGKRGVMPNDPLMLVCETASGVLADIEVFINAAYGYDVRAELVCEEGTMELARPRAGDIRLNGQQALSFPPDWRGRFADAYRIEVQSWVDNLGRKDTPGATAWDGYVASAIAEAGVKSLKSGGREEVKLTKKPGLYG
jgi:myo-inositol 2-dehydrogenase / D-chiro-inositol 1-dehydrogenase